MKKRLVLFCAMFALASIVAFAADVTGKWVGEAGGKGGPPTFNFKQTGTNLTGTQSGRGGDTGISNGKVEGNNVLFEVTRDMGDKGKITTKYSGTVDGNTMTLKAEREGAEPRTITLTKQ